MKNDNFALLPELRTSIELTVKNLTLVETKSLLYNVTLKHYEELLTLERQILSNNTKAQVLAPAQETDVWYPDDGKWVEVPFKSRCNCPPDGLSSDAYIEVLVLNERAHRVWESSPEFVDDWAWDNDEFDPDRIVAYKLTNPTI